jgi:hypothetical protein
MADPVPTDEEMATRRDDGEFICQCRLPRPDRIHLFSCWQCARCFKALLHPPVTLKEPWTQPLPLIA